MAPSLWSSLRGDRPRTPPAAGAGEYERKVLLASYYEALARAGISTDRSRGWPIERAVNEGYERVVWVFRCTNRIAGDAAKLPIVVKDGDKVLEDHPMARLLNDGMANDLETGRQFRKRLSSQILLSKRGAFVEATTSRGGTPLAYDLLPPGRTEPVPGETIDPATGRVKAIDHFRLTLRDGGTKELDPDTVRWFRDPHPIDPYSGITPLEAIGMSVELDYFARLYNVSFLRNDGRPGGVLAVRGTGDGRGDIDEKAMDRIESRFGRGPLEAGKISVVAGELSFADLSGNPRDMSYSELARASRHEIMAGFGVGDSILGNSGEKTYANAAEEAAHYWLTTMPEHLGLVTTGFDRDTDDDLVIDHDTSKVPALQRIKDLELERAAAEVDRGLRSIWSYFNLAGRADEIEETPHTRALYISAGKEPIPAREADAEALGLGTEEPAATDPAALGAPGADPAAAAPADPAAPIDPTTGAPAPVPAPGAPLPPGSAAPLVVAPGGAPITGAPDRAGLGAAIGAGKHHDTAGVQTKRLHSVPDLPPQRARVVIARETKTAPTGGQRVSSDPDPADRDNVEAQVAAVLAELGEVWVARTVARLTAPKTRKGTRHWNPEYDVDTRVGTKALDSPRIVDEARWAEDAADAVRPIVTPAARAAAAKAVADLAGDAALPEGTLDGAVEEAVRLVADAAARQASAMTEAINTRDQSGSSIEQIVTAVRGRGGRLAGWARGLATHTAAATIAGARAAAVDALTATGAVSDVEQQWLSRKDDRVRDTHEAAHGQRRALAVPFVIGATLLRYPGDPAGPLRETANCHCHVRYRATATGRFVANPTTNPTTAAAAS